MENKQYFASEEAKVRDEWKAADADGKYRKSGIIYWNHQPGKNYFSANGAGDTDMKTDILMSELAKLIVSNKKRVVDLLNQSGIPTSSSITRSALIERVGKALYGNIKFAEAIAAEIVQGGNMNAEGDTNKKLSFNEILNGTSDAAKNLANAAKNVKDLVGGVFGGKNKSTKQGQAATNNLKDQTEAVGKISGAGMGAAKYVLIALGVSAVIGGVYYYVKNR